MNEWEVIPAHFIRLHRGEYLSLISRLKSRSNISSPALSIVIMFLLLPLLPDVFAPLFIIVPFISLIVCNKNWLFELKLLFVEKNLLAIFAVLNLFWVFFCILSAKYKLDAFVMSLLWLWCTFAFFAILLSAKSREVVALCAKAMMISGLISGIIAIIQYFIINFTWIKFPNPLWRSVNSITDLFFRYKIKYLDDKLMSNITVRSNSTFINSNVYATFLLVAIPLTIYCIYNAKGKKQLAVSIISLIVSMIAIMTTFSRGAYVVLALLFIAILIYMVFVSKAKIRKWLIPIPLVLVLMPFLPMFPNSVKNRVAAIFRMDGSKVARSTLWEISRHLFVKRPIMGYGTGMNNEWDLFIHKGINEPHAHSDFWQLLLEGGIPRFAITLALVVIFFVFAVYIIRNGNYNDRKLSAAFIAAMVGIIIQGAVNYSFVDPKMTAYFMMIIALMGGYYYSIKKEKQIW